MPNANPRHGQNLDGYFIIKLAISASPIGCLSAFFWHSINLRNVIVYKSKIQEVTLLLNYNLQLL